MTNLRVAVVQGEVSGGLGAALESTRVLATEARGNGARLIAFPETWLPGYPVWLDVCRDVALWDHPPVKALFVRYATDSVAADGDAAATLSALARELEVTLVVGVSEKVTSGPGQGTLYNSLLTFDSSGWLVNHHRKLMPTFSERMIWGVGDADGLRAVACTGSDDSAARVGGLICWEHWMPLARQALHNAGERIHVAAWPTAHERNQIASRHYAFEGRCFVLVACSVMRASNLPAELEPHPDRVKTPADWVIRGGSAIIAPDGNYMVEPVFDRPCILYADLDFAQVRAESMTLDVSGHYARPDCFTFATLPAGRVPYPSTFAGHDPSR
jgi:nitrilase